MIVETHTVYSSCKILNRYIIVYLLRTCPALCIFGRIATQGSQPSLGRTWTGQVCSEMPQTISVICQQKGFHFQRCVKCDISCSDRKIYSSMSHESIESAGKRCTRKPRKRRLRRTGNPSRRMESIDGGGKICENGDENQNSPKKLWPQLFL